MRSIIRVIFMILLVTGSFLAGTAWKSGAEGKQNNSPEQESQPATARVVSENSPILPEPGSGLMEFEKNTIALFDNVCESVCFINTTRVQLDFFSRKAMEVPQGSGSGFVWDKNGHIITNYHVIQGADKATVTLAHGETYDATLVGSEPGKDLAVLKIEAPRKELQPIPIGQSESLRVGQFVMAIGNPFGLDQTMTTGIVSALGREINSVNNIPIRGVIQSDAAINPGNSGGPLLDSSGRLIGVNTAIYSPSGASAGIGFSIPVDVVKWVVPELIQFGELRRPTLGVSLASQNILNRVGIKGVLILDVEKGGAAEKAGLQPTRRNQNGEIILGDVIIKMGKEPIKSYNDLILVLEKLKPGDKVPLLVERNQEQISLDITLDAYR